MQFDYLRSLTGQYSKHEILTDMMRTYSKDVWNYALTLSGKPEMADDIMQDVFFKALQKLDTFRGEASMRTWLLKITRNTAINHRTTWFIRKVIPIDKWIETDGAGDYPSAETKALESINLDETWSIVMKLPGKLREVLILFAHHGMSHKEIAETIGVPEGTVKSRLHHARIHFAKLHERGK